MQPIASKLPHYYANDDQFSSERKVAQAKWDEVSQRIQLTLRTAVERAKSRNCIEQTAIDKYFVSGDYLSGTYFSKYVCAFPI